MDTKAIAAIVPAAGCGARAALNGNKVLAPLCGEPLLFWTLRALLEAAPLLREHGFCLSQLLIAARPEEFALIEPVIARFSQTKISIVEGGSTRQQSVYNAACSADSETKYFLVHDAARPLASTDLIARVCCAASTQGAAIAALPAADTVKITREEKGARYITSTPPREDICLAQTPQVFRRDIFVDAFERAQLDEFQGTDCASIVERSGSYVAIVEGETDNFKVTFARDLERAESVLTERKLAPR